MNTLNRCEFRRLLLLAGAAVLVSGVARSDPYEVLPYGSSGFRYRLLTAFQNPPPSWEQPGFDDATWSVGSAAFGYGGCPASTVRTDWPINTRLLLRKYVSVPPGAINLRIMLGLDNDIVALYFNATQVSDYVSHDNCPSLDSIRIDVPPEAVQAGQCLVAYYVADRGIASFFDTRILADLLGDTNGDGCVDDADLTAVILDFGTTGGDNGATDVNDDGIVDDADITEVVLRHGTGC